MTLTELRAALRKATGSDWTLCAEIEVALHKGVTFWRGAGPFLVERHGMPYNPPAYTASIDAAVTLTPSGWLFQITQAKGDQVFTARFTNPATDAECANFGWHVRENGQRMDMDTYLAALRWERSPALALCLARIEYEIARVSS